MPNRITVFILMTSLLGLTAPARAQNHIINVYVDSHDCSKSDGDRNAVDNNSTKTLVVPFDWTCEDFRITGQVIGEAEKGPQNGKRATLVLTDFDVTRTSSQTDDLGATGTFKIMYVFPRIPSATASASYEGQYTNWINTIGFVDSSLEVWQDISSYSLPFLQMEPEPAWFQSSPYDFNESDGPTNSLGSVHTIWVKLDFSLASWGDGISLPDSAVVEVVAGSSEIPTLSPLGLVIIGLLLALTGSVTLLRRAKSHPSDPPGR